MTIPPLIDVHRARYFALATHTHGEFANAMPAPIADGQVLLAVDGIFIAATPLISETGEWMTNGAGELLIVG